MKRLVLIWNIKGGVGKTTISENLLGTALSGLIDLEGECSTWAHRGRIYRRRVVHARNEARLSGLADDAAKRFWWAFVNAPAERDNTLVEAALRNASLVVIPLTPNQNDLYRTGETITAARAAGKPFLLVINRARPRVLGRDARQTAVLRETLARYRPHLWSGQITEAISFDTAAIRGVTVSDLQSARKSAVELRELFDHIRRLCSKQ